MLSVVAERYQMRQQDRVCRPSPTTFKLPWKSALKIKGSKKIFFKESRTDATVLPKVDLLFLANGREFTKCSFFKAFAWKSGPAFRRTAAYINEHICKLRSVQQVEKIKKKIKTFKLRIML